MFLEEPTVRKMGANLLVSVMITLWNSGLAPIVARGGAGVADSEHVDSRRSTLVKLHWNVAGVGKDLSTPFNVDGNQIVYTLGYRLVALDAGTGRVQWSFPDLVYPNFALSGGAVYAVTNSRSGDFLALAAGSGKLLWKTPGGLTWAIPPTAVVAGKNLFVAGSVSSGLALHRLDPATGRLSWRYQLPAADPNAVDPDLFLQDNFSADIQVAGNVVLWTTASNVSGTGPTLRALDLATGRPLWRKPVARSPLRADGGRVWFVTNSSDDRRKQNRLVVRVSDLRTGSSSDRSFVTDDVAMQGDYRQPLDSEIQGETALWVSDVKGRVYRFDLEKPGAPDVYEQLMTRRPQLFFVGSMRKLGGDIVLSGEGGTGVVRASDGRVKFFLGNGVDGVLGAAGKVFLFRFRAQGDAGGSNVCPIDTKSLMLTACYAVGTLDDFVQVGLVGGTLVIQSKSGLRGFRIP